MTPSGHTVTGDDRPVSAFDFRRPNRIGREAQVALEVVHELFTRRLGSTWGNAARAVVEVEPIGIDQVTFDDYTRSMPTPNVLATVRLGDDGLAAIAELNVQLALTLVERLLGSVTPANVPAPRRPTELEAALLADLFAGAAAALEEALCELTGPGAELTGLDFSPHLLQTFAPSDMVLLLSFRVAVRQEVETEGLLCLCYPIDRLLPILDALVRPGGDALAAGSAEMLPGPDIDDVPLVVSARLDPTEVSALDLATLRPGDVLRTDHRVGAPVRLSCEGVAVADAQLGRRGRRLAVQLAPPARTTTAVPSAAPTAAVPATDVKEIP